MTATMEQLEEAVQFLKSLPFPTGSDSPSVDYLHAELAELDGYVSGIVHRLLIGDSAVAQKLELRPDLATHLERVVQTGSESERRDAARQLEYLRFLERVMRLGGKVQQSHHTPPTSG